MAEDEAGVAEAEALVDAFLAQHQLASNQVTAPGPPLAAPLVVSRVCVPITPQQC